MPDQVALSNESGQAVAGDSPSLTLPWRVSGGENEIDALAILTSRIPTEYVLRDGTILYINSANIVDNISWSPPLWKGQAVYGAKQPQNQESPFRLSFSLSSESANVKVALAQTKWPNVAATPDPKKAIGATKNGIDGCMIDVSTFQWTEKHSVLTSVAASHAYLRQLKKVHRRFNNAPFRGFPTGEVRFRGVEGEAELGKKFSLLSFTFVQEDNLENIDCGNGVIVGSKRGQDNLDIFSVQEVDAAAGVLISRTKYAYVNQVYLAGDYSLLGIGTN